MTYRLPLATTLAIAVQMVLGGLVVGEDAGFVCPDWPLCHGQLLPKLTGLVVLELVHRASALLVSVLFIATLVSVWRHHRRDKWMVRAVWGATASLALQVVVGGLIVLLKLPGIVTTIDVMNSMLMLGLFVFITTLAYVRGHAGEFTDGQAQARVRALQVPSAALFAATAFAVFVGAVFRHSGASEALFGRMDYLQSHGQTVPPSLGVSNALLALHAVTGVLLVAAAAWFVVGSLRAGALKGWSVWTAVCVLMEWVLGMLTLLTGLDLVLATLHWTMAACLFGLASFALSYTTLAVRLHTAGRQAGHPEDEAVVHPWTEPGPARS
ncbi:hypothetical protein GCM10010885_08350 [Alicyclobacillus cellulosilyticus]|uniref:Cytochrome c oxidase assembly protein subunit 15 n=1 Tax=Alicyclobacillus cellulosilyticus TaxID=1003997 RepID=A0A917K5F5_9BACL|nr:COX15/CtaA family protein [Alicyclobacillus cellulosilyticus]GGJ01462.1 hypothetical protein GCM10010885_08350 [Alicyclobacillus cellulosilyticus]